MGVRATLRIVQTTDLHGALRPYDYFADRPAPGTGLADLAAHLEEARAADPNTLYFDCGDLIQGTPLVDLAPQSGAPHPAVMALNALGCDAATLGNHDFDFGFDVMMAAYSGRDWPLVSANLVAPDGSTVFAPWHILERDVSDPRGAHHPIRIGIFGVLPPQTAMWNGHHLVDRARVTDAMSAARSAARDLRAAGADLVVALAHSGAGEIDPAIGAENVAQAIAGLDTVDLVLAGHTHAVLPDPGPNAAKLLQAGAFGSHIGVAEIDLSRDADKWSVMGIQCRTLRPPVEGTPAPEILRVTEAAHATTLEQIRREVGRTEVALTSHFNLLGFDRGAALIAAAQTWRASQLFPGRRCLAAVAPFRAGGAAGPGFYVDIPKGPLTLRNISELYLYPNEQRFIEVNGAQIRDWLDHAAGIYNRIDPSGGELTDAARPTYNADAMFGLTYRIDLSRPARFDADGHQVSDASRIVDMCVDGRRVEEDEIFTVVTNSYRASGGGGFHHLATCPVLEAPPESARDVLAWYVADSGIVAPDGNLPFSFSPLGGWHFVALTSPDAAVHEDALSAIGAAVGPVRPDGFLPLHLTL